MQLEYILHKGANHSKFRLHSHIRRKPAQEYCHFKAILHRHDFGNAFDTFMKLYKRGWLFLAEYPFTKRGRIT